MIEGLAEHILLELSARMASIDESKTFAEHDISSMKEDIFVLMLAAGQQDLESAKVFEKGNKIRDILTAFSVGTENRKKMTVGPPDPSKVGPLRSLAGSGLVSVEKHIADQTVHLRKRNRINGSSNEEECPPQCRQQLGRRPAQRRQTSNKEA